MKYRAVRLFRRLGRGTMMVVVAKYALLVLFGLPLAIYALINGAYVMGFRVLGIFGLVVALTLTLVRLDALERSTPLIDGIVDVSEDRDGDDETEDAEDVDEEDTSTRKRLYEEYVLTPQFRKVEMGMYAVGGVSFVLSFALISL